MIGNCSATLTSCTGILRMVIFTLLTVGIFFLPYSSNAQTLKDLLNPQGQITIDPNIVINPNAVVCFPPFTKKNNKCVCPPGKKKVGNTCENIQIQILCQAPFKPNAAGNKCVCPANKIRIGNNCIGVNAIPCPAPFVKNNQGICGCPFGKKKVGNTCENIQIQILCKAPFKPNAAGNKCVCPAGKKKAGNTCVPKQAAPAKAQCNWPFVYKNSNNTCVCARGYKLNNAGNKCIRKKAASTTPAKPVLPRQLITEIQYCLGRLGYNAGPADGASGRRTRAAWSSFRIDEGLRARPNTLADEVTQDRLFQACAKLDQAGQAPAPVVPEPDDDAPTGIPASDTGTNFNPETGYPAIQCASKAVAILLQGLVGKEPEIGICGEVCVPIPDGMTPEQISATSANINWCRNCTKVGKDGLLCTADAETEEDAAN